ncbi:hypothetical protein NAT51_08105 [Flavobacterium amniphilum]|uniref:hypothetical protein n=1 Tax=Flavobacterium amniphilum TaxID=1834035 RepID=UPI00202A085F|nr:hypothetical protein [Flavobacterium amniphilum]MCL9805481.1 hypothetical protein [Flavobacterium amniphilum]
MMKKNPSTQFKTILLIIIYGIISGLLMSINLYLVDFLGYLIIFTGLFLELFLLLSFPKTYKLILKSELTVINGLFVTFPAALICIIIYRFSEIYGKNIVYTDFGKKELMGETILSAILITLIMSFIVIPIQNSALIKRKKTE